MKTRAALAAVIVLLTFGLTGCMENSADSPGDTSIKTKDYRGAKVECIKNGLSETSTRSCDFEGFYAAHPDALDKDDTDPVDWQSYKGKKIACLRDGLSKAVTRSCDFVRFYHDYPTALPKS